MSNLVGLREERKSIAMEMKRLLDNNPEGSKWGGELKNKFDELDAKLQNVDAAIARNEKFLDDSAQSKFGIQEHDVSNQAANNIVKPVLNKWFRGGDNAISAEEYAAIRNTMSVGVGSEGGFTVDKAGATTLIEAMKAYGGLRGTGKCEIITTDKGGDLPFATTDDTSEEGEIVAENGSAADSDATFGTLSIPVYKFSSKVITVPFELLQDSSVNIEAMVMARLSRRLARITEKKFTVGTGTSEPRGIITAATVGVAAATGNATGITYDHLVTLEHSVDPAYRDANCAFMFNDNTLRYVRMIKDNNGRPIFSPSYESGPASGAPSQILGYDIVINQQMANLGASAKSVGFGNLFPYKIRDVMQATFFRFTDSAYSKKGQVGFMAWSRHGGNFIDVGGAFRLYQNSAT